MLRCEQIRCRYCKKYFTGHRVCSTEPVMLPNSPDMDGSVLKCMTFKQNEHYPNVNEFQPGRGPDGLYPGQLRR